MKINFVYATDLHGNISKYQDVFKFAVEQRVNLIHLGADLLPKGTGILKKQKTFIKGFLKNFYTDCEEKKIKVLAFFGNDDIYTRKKYFRKYASLLDEEPYNLKGYTFSAYPYVMDYPFGLKSGCKWDYDGWRCAEDYISNPCDFDDSGYYQIEDIENYFTQKGTIENDLKKIHADRKTIMSMHMPPYALDLDICHGDRRVGSQSILNWIISNQPLLFLSGHIHESPEVSGVWKTMVNKTMAIQPGQDRVQTTMVYIEIDKSKVNAHLIG